MRSWKQLESDFRSLRAEGFGCRLDHQCGAAGEHWHLAGSGSGEARSQFEAFARLAGIKVFEVQAVARDAALTGESDPLARWYKVLWQLSGAQRTDFYGIQTDAEGNDAGAVFMGRKHEATRANPSGPRQEHRGLLGLREHRARRTPRGSTSSLRQAAGGPLRGRGV